MNEYTLDEIESELEELESKYLRNKNELLQLKIEALESNRMMPRQRGMRQREREEVVEELPIKQKKSLKDKLKEMKQLEF